MSPPGKTSSAVPHLVIPALHVLLLLLLPVPAAAQVQLGPGDQPPSLPADEQIDAIKTPPGRVLRRIEIPEDDPAASLFAGGTIHVRGFRYVGNVAMSDQRLDAATRAYIGEGRSYGALLEARDRVTLAYINAGYISSGAVLPDNPVTDGIVEIHIIEGRLTTIEVSTNGSLRDDYLIDRLEIESQTEALNLNALRRRLRILKRDPNIERITSELAPGTERDQSILTVSIEEPRPYSLSAEFDDYITPAIGGLRGRFNGGVRNLTGWGEQSSLSYSVAEGLHDVSARAAVPVTRWDTAVELRIRQAWSEIVESPLDDFDIESRTQSYALRVSQPIVRERTHEIALSFTAEWKRSKSTLLGGLALSLDPEDDGRSTVSALRIATDGWWRGKNRAFSARLTLSQGLDALSAGSDALDLDGEFTAILIQVQAVEYLPWWGLRVLSRLDAQAASDSLLGLERFSVGGHASVRGFRENLLVRDQGVTGSLELRIPLPTLGPIERLEVGVFGDGGYAKNRDGGPGDAVGSIGLGLHAEVTRHTRLSIQWAQSLDDPSGDFVRNHMQDDGVHFSLRIGFP